jgi:hypothetical protein
LLAARFRVAIAVATLTPAIGGMFQAPNPRGFLGLRRHASPDAGDAMGVVVRATGVVMCFNVDRDFSYADD